MLHYSKILCKKYGYFQILKTSEDWRNIAGDFVEKWNFPQCVGRLDGKHIGIILPKRKWLRVKSLRSLVPLAIVDADYQFKMCDFGTNGLNFTNHKVFF